MDVPLWPYRKRKCSAVRPGNHPDVGCGVNQKAVCRKSNQFPDVSVISVLYESRRALHQLRVNEHGVNVLPKWKYSIRRTINYNCRAEHIRSLFIPYIKQLHRRPSLLLNCNSDRK